MEFLTALEMGRNIYLTGFAGTGKSTVAVEGMERLRKAKRKFIAMAPTGMAAAKIEGETIHSMFRLNPHICILDEHKDCQFINKAKLQVIRKAETFFIDEISMVRVDIFDGIHLTMKKNMIAGGMKKKQIVCIGDLGQLKPIVSKNEESVLSEKYTGITFLDSDIFKELNFIHIDLAEIVRQNDQEFINALRVIREGGKSDYFRRFVGNEVSGVILAPRNETVTMYNEQGLNAQEGELYTFDADIDAGMRPEEFSFEAQIRVKDGCKIMYLVNSRENPLRNGTLGTFRVKDGRYFFQYKTTEWPIERHTVNKYEYVYDNDKDEIVSKIKGSITQYPIKLAYAMSIHKAQGMTFDDMTADFRGGCFEKSQYYVALSRATGPDALRIII